MTPNKIVMMKAVVSKSVTKMRDLFEYRATGRMPWLQRLLFRVLTNLEAFAWEKTETVVYRPVPTDELKGAILEAVRSVCDVQKLIPSEVVVVVGRDAYRKLIMDRELVHAFEFNVDMEVRGRGWHRMWGLNLYACPWADGLVVLPRVVMSK